MEIFQCDEKDLTKLCIRSLASGEKNGRLGYEPPSTALECGSSAAAFLGTLWLCSKIPTRQDGGRQIGSCSSPISCRIALR